MENNRDKRLAFESIVWYSVVAKVEGALMNRMVLKELTDEHVVYFYYPDGIGPCGEIEYIFGEEEPKVLKLGNGDKGYFANMALDFLDDCIDADMFPFRWTVAWN